MCTYRTTFFTPPCVNGASIWCAWKRNITYVFYEKTRFLLYIECVVIFDILLMFLIFVSTFPLSSFMDFSMMSVTFLNSRLIVSTWYPPSTDDSCPVRKPCNMSLQLPAFSSDCTTAKIIKNNMRYIIWDSKHTVIYLIL